MLCSEILNSLNVNMVIKCKITGFLLSLNSLLQLVIIDVDLEVGNEIFEKFKIISTNTKVCGNL